MDPILVTAGEAMFAMLSRALLLLVFSSLNALSCITDRDLSVSRESAGEGGSGDGREASSSTGQETTTSSASEASGSTLGVTSSTGTAGGRGTSGGSETQELCESSGGAWDLEACGHLLCGAPSVCETLVPGCDCGLGSTFVDAEGCVGDDACKSVEFDCSGQPCIAPSQYCDIWGASINCDPTPRECENSYTCACLGPAVGGSCETQEDGALFVYVPGGP